MTTLVTMFVLVMITMVVVVVTAAREIGLREAVREIAEEIAELIGSLVRHWVIGLPRRLAEFLLPPHIVCPPVFQHLSLQQWRDNAKECLAEDDDGLGWCERHDKTVFEWLEARNLPPVPRDEYCPQKRKWVKDMNRDERESYLKEVRG